MIKDNYMSILNSHKHRHLPPRLYCLPQHKGDIYRLGQLFRSACSIECADIIERHTGLVMLISPDINNTLRLYNEIQQFTNLTVTILYDWGTLPYDDLSPSQSVTSSRLSCLYHLPKMAKGVIILSIHTLMQRVCPQEFLNSNVFVLKKNQVLSQDKIRSQLERAGYRFVQKLMSHGEFTTRGNLLDFYPMGSQVPYRLNLLKGKIHNLLALTPGSQHAISGVNTIKVLPTQEFPTDKNSIEIFRTKWRENFHLSGSHEHIYQQVSTGASPNGIQYWQPLFFNEPLPALFSYLPVNTLIVNIGNIEIAADHAWKDLKKRYQARRTNPLRPVLEPDTLWLSVDVLFRELSSFPRMALEEKDLLPRTGNINMGYFPLPNVRIQSKNKRPLENLERFITNFKGSIIFSVKSKGRLVALKNLLGHIKLNIPLIKHLNQAGTTGCYMMISAYEHGFLDSIYSRAMICESDLLEELVDRRRQNNLCRFNRDECIKNLEDLHPNQPVVHLEHGIGRYAGLTTLEAGGILGEYIILYYDGEDKLYVPVCSLHLIHCYSGGNSENIPLHKLGSDTWKREKQKAVEKVRDVAAELLDLSSKRATKTGFSFKCNQEKYQRFCKTFQFKTTPDQQEAINAVLSDMCQPMAMDRLVCGDVGFGKTEVAMRASFLAVENNKQVAVLVPTTLLAQQHFDNFRNRFAEWPIKIEMMSRFRSKKEQLYILDDVARGKVNIIIGSHRLLQDDLRWKDLGLLIIDEEHRFGVQQKERIKVMQTGVDILTLTATPIPRTLSMAMSGIRDLSIITTPPQRRLAIKTFISEYDSMMIREAILREVLRGGQVYYLFNNIKKIEGAAKKLEKLIPEARIHVGHGQMCERDLEKVMHDFQNKRFNVLVCTTIIETGIDISSVNTIVIEGADRFGLAQLHQLRGRVGRSHHQAYAYLLTENKKVISSNSKKRLEALTSLEDLGAGFSLATHDLEIRGAGELLGSEQSGQIATIGFSFYMELLENAVQALKNGREPSLEDLTRSQVDVELHIPTLLPDTFISDINTRLSFYKRIAMVKTDHEIKEIEIELIDRFGRLPQSVKNLLKITTFRQSASTIGIKRIKCNERGGFIEFGNNHCVDQAYLMKLLQKKQTIYCLDGQNKLKFILNLNDRETRLKFTEDLLYSFLTNKKGNLL